MRLLSSLYVSSTGLVSKETSVRLWLLPLRLLHLRESRTSPSSLPFTPPPKQRRFERCLSLCYHVLASYHLVCSPPTTFQPSLPFILLLVIFSPVTSNASSQESFPLVFFSSPLRGVIGTNLKLFICMFLDYVLTSATNKNQTYGKEKFVHNIS